MTTYEWTDPDGSGITVEPSDITDGIAVLSTSDPSDGNVVHIIIPRPDALHIARRVATAICEAAGVPAPIVLERPEPRDGLVDVAGQAAVHVTPSPAGHSSNAPGVMLHVGGPNGTGIRLVDDEPQRVAVALVDAMRDAESEPDPAEVDELARVLAKRRHGLSPDQTDINDALVSLRWMKQREGAS